MPSVFLNVLILVSLLSEFGKWLCIFNALQYGLELNIAKRLFGSLYLFRLFVRGVYRLLYNDLSKMPGWFLTLLISNMYIDVNVIISNFLM